MKHPPAAGMLLTAEADLMESAFMRSVIYLLEHHEGGSMGVILNRPLQMELQAVWEDARIV
jgi:putative transcriptional regulator